MRTVKSFYIILLVFIMNAVIVTDIAIPSQKQQNPKSISSFFPDFIPTYYKQVFPDQFSLWQTSQTQEENKVQFTNDQNEFISIQYTKSNRSIEEGILKTSFVRYAKELENKDGHIINIDAHFIQLLINKDKNFVRLITIYGTPKGVFNWEYKSKATNEKQRDMFINQLLLCIGKHRYEEAFSQGNVIMGFWGREIHQYAKLLSEIDSEKAITVYENHLKTTPFNYEAHFEYIKLSDKERLKTESAKAILKNAEQEHLLNEAAKFLGEQIPNISSFSVLEKNCGELQLILIPLPPCNPWLLEESAKAYEKITGISVKIQRLPEVWHLEAPGRIPYQRSLEKVVANFYSEINDFTGWDIEKFRNKLFRAAEKEGPYAVYSVKKLFEKIEQEIKKGKGQWEINPYLIWFQKALLPYRTNDIKTMYVGITEIDIYSGDTNFVFSLHDKWQKTPGTLLQASILSYARMLAESNGKYQSMKRLVERIAKELVPASLKSLSIPRSVDPTCPYSYADGLGRLDQKTFELSEYVKKAIQKYKSRQTVTECRF